MQKENKKMKLNYHIGGGSGIWTEKMVGCIQILQKVWNSRYGAHNDQCIGQSHIEKC